MIGIFVRGWGAGEKKGKGGEETASRTLELFHSVGGREKERDTRQKAQSYLSWSGGGGAAHSPLTHDNVTLRLLSRRERKKKKKGKRMK